MYYNIDERIQTNIQVNQFLPTKKGDLECLH